MQSDKAFLKEFMAVAADSSLEKTLQLINHPNTHVTLVETLWRNLHNKGLLVMGTRGLSNLFYHPLLANILMGSPRVLLVLIYILKSWGNFEPLLRVAHEALARLAATSVDHQVRLLTLVFLFIFHQNVPCLGHPLVDLVSQLSDHHIIPHERVLTVLLRTLAEPSLDVLLNQMYTKGWVCPQDMVPIFGVIFEDGQFKLPENSNSPDSGVAAARGADCLAILMGRCAEPQVQRAYQFVQGIFQLHVKFTQLCNRENQTSIEYLYRVQSFYQEEMVTRFCCETYGRILRLLREDSSQVPVPPDDPLGRQWAFKPEIQLQAMKEVLLTLTDNLADVKVRMDNRTCINVNHQTIRYEMNEDSYAEAYGQLTEVFQKPLKAMLEIMGQVSRRNAPEYLEDLQKNYEAWLTLCQTLHSQKNSMASDYHDEPFLRHDILVEATKMLEDLAEELVITKSWVCQRPEDETPLKPESLEVSPLPCLEHDREILFFTISGLVRRMIAALSSQARTVFDTNELLKPIETAEKQIIQEVSHRLSHVGSGGETWDFFV